MALGLGSFLSTLTRLLPVGFAILIISATTTVAAQTGTITTCAGNMELKGKATSVCLQGPKAVSVDSSGNVLVKAQSVALVDASGNIRVLSDISGDAFAYDRNDNLLFADAQKQQLFRRDAITGTISVIAGNGTAGFSGDGGPATAAHLQLHSYYPDQDPVRLGMDGSGNIYFIDSGNYRVRKIDAVSGTIITVTDQSGFVSPYGRFKISGLAVDSPGNVYFSTTSCSYDPEHLCFPFHTVIYAIPAGSTASTYVVNGAWWSFSCSDNGDGGPALQAKLSAGGIGGLAIDNIGRLVILDTACGARRIDSGGIINTFTPVGGADVVFDRNGNGLFAGGNQVVRLDAATGQTSLFAGTGYSSYCGDGGPADSAGTTPSDLALDGAGNLFVSEGYGAVSAGDGNNRIRRIDAQTRNISTVAGNGQYQFSGDGPALEASFLPGSITTDVFGDLYFSEQLVGRVLRVDLQAGTLTNTGTPSGDLQMGNDGNLLVLSSGIVWRVNTITGNTTVAATPVNESSYEMAIDSSGNMYVSGFLGEGMVVYRIDGQSGEETRFAGTGNSGNGGDNGSALDADFREIEALATDMLGNVYVAEDLASMSYEYAYLGIRVRKIDIATRMITPVAGTLEYGFSGDAGPATEAKLNGVHSLVIDGYGNLFIADSNNKRVRKVQLNLPITFSLTAMNLGIIQVGQATNPAMITISNVSLPEPLAISSIEVTGDFARNGGTCGEIVGQGESCTIGIAFLPAAGGKRFGQLIIRDNASAVPQVIVLGGTGKTGPRAILSADELTFSAQVINTTSAGKSVIITNAGADPLSISAINVSGDFMQANNCPDSLPPQTNCSITLAFVPTNVGPTQGKLAITTNSPGSPHIVALAGDGSDYALSAPAGTSAIVQRGGTATFNLILSTTDGFNDRVFLACSGAPAASTCTVAPPSVAVVDSAPVPITVTFTTTGATRAASALGREGPFSGAMAVFIALSVVGSATATLQRKRKMFAQILCLAFVFGASLLLSQCGPPPGRGTIGGGTRPGNYTITIVGAAGAATRSIDLNLTIP